MAQADSIGRAGAGFILTMKYLMRRMTIQHCSPGS